jgi:Fibronectin type III domain
MNFCTCKKLCAFAVLFLFIIQTDLSAQIQVYPVSLTTQLTPPYSVNLADYAAPGCEQLKVIIVQRDLTQAPYMLYLKMQIELNGRVIIRTSPQYIPPPLTLEPGIPTIISGTDLYPFFDPQNMDFVGYSRETYMDTRLLPEGAYIITFTAYDYTRREVALSIGGSMFCYLAKTDPPLLNLPLNNAAIPSSSSQFINFQWLSRTTSSPNSAQSTRYHFDLFEIRLDGRSPAEIVQSMRPLFTAETDRTSLAYSIADPTLESGLRYAWRVRAFDTEGRDYIRNNGYSEVFSFVYGVAENTVFSSENIENFIASAISPRAAKLTWDATSDYDSYKVLYRRQGGEPGWYEEETVQSTFELNGLSPGNIYDCKVQGKKNSVWGGFSESDTVLLPMPEVIVCGSEFSRNPVSNREPLRELMKLQEIDAGGFMVTVIEAIPDGSPGRFSGRGFVQVPLFANKKIKCEFRNILINTDFQLADGIIRLLTDNREGGDNAIWDVDAVFEGGTNNGNVRSGTDGVSVFLTDIVIPDAGAILVDTAAKEIVVVNSYGELIHTDITQQLEDKPKSLTIKDSEGNLYSVDTQTGKATSIGKAPAGGTQQQVTIPSVISSGKGSVTFEATPDLTKYAFDKRNPQYVKSSLFTEEYKTIKMEDGSIYDIPFKLIPAGETDVVLAKAVLKDMSLKPDSIIFQSGTGTRYLAKSTGTKGEYILTLPSGKDNDGIDVYAMYPNKGGQPYLLGKLTIMSYSWKRPKVVIVPVNGNTLDEAKVKAALDKVYLPVAVDWQVSTDKSDFTASADSLDVIGSGLFSQYTPGMKKLNNAFMVHLGQDYDPIALYLFVLEKSDDKNITGDMPRSKQFGYLFTGAVGHGKAADEAISRTIAHELSHGIFHLNHTFDTQYQIAKASTQNLMDYTDGTDLVKHQWDAIHDPGIVIGMFERDEEGAMSLPCLGWFDDCENVLQMLEKIRNARLKGTKIKLKGQNNPDESTLVANLVKIGDTDYKKIRLIYKPEAKDYSMDPTKYDVYNQQFFKADGNIEEQNGFVYLKDGNGIYKIIVEDEASKIEKLKVYLYGKGGSYESISKLFNDSSVLTPVKIKDVREQIESLKNEEQKKELYLELQKKVPYHNQRNNNQEQSLSDRMCNLTSEAMCLEYLGISCPKSNMQFEDYMEQIRKDKKFGDRTTLIARQKVAEYLGACSDKKSYENTFSNAKDNLSDYINLKLKSGCAVMIGVWPICKGHLVRVQNVTNEGLIIDDPYGKVTDFNAREKCKSGRYDTNSKTEEISKGSDNLWKWNDIKDITIKYVEVYCKCK